MKQIKEKYFSILKKIYVAWKPEDVSVKAKIVLLILAVIVSILLSLLRNLLR